MLKNRFIAYLCGGIFFVLGIGGVMDGDVSLGLLCIFIAVII